MVRLGWIGLLIGCGTPTDSTDEGGPPAGSVDYSVRGPFEPSTYSGELTGRSGVVLKTQVWYPTEDSTAPAGPYDGLLPSNAVTGGAAACDETRPVLVFSHGNTGIRYQTSFLMEHLASHGFVVVAPDHTLNTFTDNDTNEFPNLVLRRPDDVRDSFDWLVDEPTVAGCIDADAGYAVSGHSFGGYTALAVAGATVNDFLSGDAVSLHDDRVWATVPLAPWDAAGAITDGTSEITVPTLVLTGKLDELTSLSQVNDLWRPLTVTPRRRGVFQTAGHYSFAPVSCLLLDGDGCGEGFIPIEEFEVLVNEAVTSFLSGVYDDALGAGPTPAESEELKWTVE